MIFDKFCTIVERHLPDLRMIAEEMKLFLFEKPAHIALSKTVDKEFLDCLDVFTLPFRVTGIEDPGSLIIFIDVEADNIGFSKKRMFIEVCPAYRMSGSYADTSSEKDNALFNKRLKDENIDETCCTIILGFIFEVVWFGDQYKAHGLISRVIVADKNKKTEDIMANRNESSPDFQEYQKSIKNAITALEELAEIYTKDKFVLEQSPVVKKKLKDAKKILRSHQRPSYTILDARTIREKLGIKHEPGVGLDGRKSPVPHERRRHPRRLTVESGYKENKVIIIPATWIGTSEKVSGNKIYKVRLDL